MVSKWTFDFRVAIRRLAKAPGFAVIAILTLGLGFGANAAIYSALHGILLRPLPYRDPGKLVAVYESVPQEHENRIPLSLPAFLSFRNHAKSFEGMAAYRLRNQVVTGLGEPEQVNVGNVTGGFFEVLYTDPQLGRALSTRDEDGGDGDVVVVGHAYWKTRLASDPSWVGRSLNIGGRPHTVIGVLPSGFRFSMNGTVPDLFVPQVTRGSAMTAGNHMFNGVARLKAGVSLPAGRQELSGLANGFAQLNPDTNMGFSAEAFDFHDEQVGSGTKPALYLLMVASGLLLLIACVNVTNLLLVKALAREQEVAIRVALGASNREIFRHFMAEGILIAVAGAVVGLVIGLLTLKVLELRVPPSEVLNHFRGLRFEPAAILLTLVLGLGSTLLFAIAPVAQGRRLDLEQALREGGRGHSGGRGRLRQVFAAGAVALCAFLLLGTGLLLRSLSRLQSVNLGYNSKGVYTFRVALPSTPRYSGFDKKLTFQQEMLGRLRQQPGVAAAEAVWVAPLGGQTNQSGVLPTDLPLVPMAQWPSENVNSVSSGYFRAMGIPMIGGRGIDESDSPHGPRVVVVNAAFAQKYWPGQNAVGKAVRVSVQIGDETDFPPWQVVGVVSNTILHEVSSAPEPEIYLPLPQFPPSNPTFMLRSSGVTAGALAPLVKAQVHSVDGDLAVTKGRPLEDYLEDQLSSRKSALTLLGVFAILALSLASFGIYGIVAFQVQERKREIGIRIALGAPAREIYIRILRLGFGIVGSGMAVGWMMSIPGRRLVSELLFETSPLDFFTHLSVAICLLVVALAASMWPAMNAVRVDPARALRDE